jgi:hypothetical protein
MDYSYDRSETFRRNIFLQSHYTDSNGGDYGPFDFLGSYGRTNYDIGTGVRGWKDLIAQGADASSARLKSKNGMTFPNGEVKASYIYTPSVGPNVNGFITFRGNFAAYMMLNHVDTTPPTQGVEGLSQALATKFRASIKDATRAWSSGVFAGELRKTIQMVKRPLQGVRNLAKGHIDRSNEILNQAIRRRRRGGASRSSVLRDVNHAISDSYLAYSYGVKPLERDLEDGIDALDRLSGHLDLKEEIYANVKGTNNVSAVDYEVLDPGPYNMLKFDLHYRQETLEKFRCSGAVTLEGQGMVQANEVVGLAPADFIATAWNLLPWSFLVDYAWNVNQAIDSCLAPLSALRWYSSSLKQTTKVVCEPRFNEAATNSYNSAIVRHSFSVSSPGKCTATLEALIRGKINLEDYRLVPQFKLPGFSEKPAQWLNVAALLAGQGIARSRFTTLIN